MIDLEYNFILSKFGETIYTIDQELFFLNKSLLYLIKIYVLYLIMSTINLSGSYQILHSKNKSKFEVIELFAGCGGMALGFENAGLNTKLLVDINKNSCETLQKKNRPNWNVINQDITQLDSYYQGVVEQDLQKDWLMMNLV